MDKATERQRKTGALSSKLWEAIREDQKGWLMCLAMFVINVVRSNINYSFGVFVVQFEELWHKSLAEQNWIGTLSSCINLSFAPVSVAFIRSLRCRGYRWSGIIGTVVLAISCLGSSFVTSLEWMFFTHSLLYGVGSSLIYMASSLLIGEYFDKDHKYHVLATSILLCSYPVGSLLFNPINASLVTRFGWRVTYRFTSALILVTGLVCCWFFSAKDSPNIQRLDEQDDEDDDSSSSADDSDDDREVEEESSRKLNGLTNKVHRRCCTWSEIKARPEIALWFLGNGVSFLCFLLPFMNLAYYMKLHGISVTQSSWAITLLSLAECCTYIVASIMGDYLKGKLVYINVIAASALSLICIFWPVVDVNYSAICFMSAAMGGFLGMTIVYTYAASGEVTQLPIDIAWSLTNLWSGLGILAGPFFSGVVFDVRQSYDDVFHVVGVVFALDAFIFCAVVYFQKKRQTEDCKRAMIDMKEMNVLLDTRRRKARNSGNMHTTL